jgi:hypothetical protein
MNPLGKQWLVTSAGAVLLALAAVVVVGGSRTQPARAPSPGMESVTGTVKTVDLRGGTFDLVTGVGLALRIQRVRLPAPLRVQGAAPESAAVVLVPGSIVRVAFRPMTAGTEASTVELVRPAPRRVKP